jgi:long-chain acyl-CoA synthetase
LTANCLLFAKSGARNILISNPKDLPTLLGYFERAEVTVLTGVNTLFNGLLHAPGFNGFDFSGFRLIVAGGAALQEVVARKWAAVTGTPIVEGYGLTEASPFVSCNLLEGEFTGTIGIPIPSTFVEIRDDAGLCQSIGQEGEICIRGPQIMKGYWQRPLDTAAVLDEDGWLKSGDVGFIDERGAVTITDRKKDLILVSGFNVYPNEIESVVASHPEVFESAAVGVPDAQTGEAVRVYVVKLSEKMSESDLIAHCRTQLTAYKIPRSVVFVDQLPKSNVGKILRRELRERVV